MIKISNPADCCGCTACASVCNHDAITMIPDALGFLYPEVDVNMCADCGLCEKVCSFNDNYDTSLNFTEPLAYGARHKDIDEVMKSRSGAVFVALSDYVIDNGGVVYGAGYTDHFRVVHKRATTKEERDEFRGSKYVQSDLNVVFRQVRKDLRDGMTVLFSGTPCQTSGLNSYVGKRLRENLILVDIVCHGVPGPFIWRDYLMYQERKHKSKILNVDFREKTMYGWKDHKEAFKYECDTSKWNVDIEKKLVKWKTWYTNFFYKHIMFRHSCGNCRFCNLKRPSDITLADFWGWEKTGSTINEDNKGLNLVLVNTSKGKDIFNVIKENLYLINATPDAYLQPNLKYPSRIHKKRMQFEKDYIHKGFEYIFKKKYSEQPLLRRVLSKIIKMIKK